VSLTFSNELWNFVAQRRAGLKTLAIRNPQTDHAMESFNVIWFKLPCLVAIFIAPLGPISSLGLHLTGAVQKGAAMAVRLCSHRRPVHWRRHLRLLRSLPLWTHIPAEHRSREPRRADGFHHRYFDLFVNVILGVGLVFELPV